MSQKTMEVNIPTFNELTESLSDENRTTKIIDELHTAYMREITQIMSYALSSEKPSIAMSLFSKRGSQEVAEFAVSDLGIERKESYNWHLQNTSQAKYMGCILIQNNRVSTHH